MEILSERLVNKSIEAFIMGIEIYNKPTIKYRIEGFSFFICNAWELMLKAQIVKKFGEDEIYYKDNPSRTISLENSIDLLFTDKKSNLRKNLLQIIELRNTSTHFITEDYEHIYAPLFQACVVNYMSKMQEFHDVSISDHISQNFLTLSVRIDQLNDEEIKAKYSASMAKKILSEKEKIVSAISESNSDFAIPVETRFYITKIRADADLQVAFDKTADTSVGILREVKDPNVLYPLTQKDVLRLVNKKLKSNGILITKTIKGENTLTPFTSHDFGLFNKFYGIKSDGKYCYHYKLGNRYGYSQKVCDFIVEEIGKNPETFVENLKKDTKK